jgi:class 3 adenylate cyclase
MDDALRPCRRTIVAVDIEDSSARPNHEKAQLRDAMYALLDEALVNSGVTEDLRDPPYDRGDGAIMLVHPVGPDPCGQLLDRGIRTMSDRLTEHNTAGRPGFRLRAAIHSGDVYFDRFGMFGEDVDLTMRLLEAPDVKRRLRQTSAPLVLVVSEHVHHSVRRRDAPAFEPLARVLMGAREHVGWVHVPSETSWSVAASVKGGD